MALEFKLLSVLWLVAACIAASAATTTAAPTTTASTASAATTTAAPTTTASAATTTAAPTTTASAATTTAAPTTTASAATSTAAPTTTASAATSTAAPTTTASAATSTAAPTTTASAATSTAAPTTTASAATSTAAPTTTASAATTTAAPTTTASAATSTAAPTTTASAATTTAAPTTTSAATTTTPAGQTTTSAATTTTPAGQTTTSAATTTTPAGQTTTSAATTTTPAGQTTTSAAATTTTVLTTTKLPDPCDVNPCGDGITCEPRANQTFACLCLAGDFYNAISKQCETAKVFPGQLGLPKLQFYEKMTDKASPEFQEASQKIIAELFDVFKKYPGYSGATVLELRPIQNGKAWSRSVMGVDASVEIAFAPNTDITTETVTGATVNASKCVECLLNGATFKEEQLCDKNACDGTTTVCNSKDGSFKCSCKENYIKTNFSSRICIACPSGKKADGSGCVNCPFGYSGFNCNESWQLVLVIVGSVLGGLLLITLILLPVVASMCSKKSSKKNKNADIGKSYVSNSPAKAPLVNRGFDNNQAASLNGSAYASAGVPRIPRATTTSWDSRTNLEMTPSNSRQNLVPAGRNSRLYEETDDMNPYAQVRNQSSLYGQNRPQINPYASNQGHANPYYMHGNGRQFD